MRIGKRTSLVFVWVVLWTVILGAIPGYAVPLSDNNQAGNRVFSAPGVYGDGHLTAIEGDVTIDTSGVTLKNMVITGRLIVSENVQSGVVRLEGVSVNKETLLKGNGKYRVVFKDTWADLVQITGNGSVILEAIGGTAIKQMDVSTTAELNESALKGPGFINLTVKAGNGIWLRNTKLGKVTVNNVLSDFNILTGSAVEELVVNGRVRFLHLNPDVEIGKLVANGGLLLSGTGRIGTAEINANEIQMTRPADVMKIKTGINKPTYTGTFIESFKPLDGTAAVALRPSLSVAFSKKVKIFSYNAQWMVDLREDGPKGPTVLLTATASTSGNRTVVNAKPQKDLKPNQLYYLSVSPVEDYDKNPVLGNRGVYFRTVTTEKPQIADVFPANQATDVPVNAEVLIRFSKIVRKTDNAQLTKANAASVVTLKRGSPNGAAEPFAAEVTSEMGQTVIKVLTDYFLMPDTVYYIGVKGLEDTGDQALQGQQFSFKTTSARRVPLITGLQPVSTGAEGTRELRVAFSTRVRLLDGRPITPDTYSDLVQLRMGAADGHKIPFVAEAKEYNGQMTLSITPIAALTPGMTYHVALDEMEDYTGLPVVGRRQFSFVAQ